MNVTVNFLVQQHTFDSEHGNIVGLTDSVEGVMSLVEKHMRANSLVHGREFELMSTCFAESAGTDGNGAETFFPLLDETEAPEHQKTSLKITTLVVR